ncbi:hypothetical protein EVAR_23242_1 [Eumeta japonica]|uniref:Uncharacterized protein n=1 Tax=Eumeta variegata TaxID=151549 RepID=A0A4C1VEA4_EUMVA|nr:hypothetical protein EVAR_23242_1 [Eumeta japonica]
MQKKTDFIQIKTNKKLQYIYKDIKPKLCAKVSRYNQSQKRPLLSLKTATLAPPSGVRREHASRRSRIQILIIILTSLPNLWVMGASFDLSYAMNWSSEIIQGTSMFAYEFMAPRAYTPPLFSLTQFHSELRRDRLLQVYMMSSPNPNRLRSKTLATTQAGLARRANERAARSTSLSPLIQLMKEKRNSPRHRRPRMRRSRSALMLGFVSHVTY